MDEQNPAVRAQTQVPPALLEAVAKDPEAMVEHARKLLLVNTDALFRYFKDPNAPVGLRLQYNEQLAKIGGVGQYNKTTAASGPSVPQFSIQFNFSQEAQAKLAPQLASVVEVQAKQITE